MDCGTENVTAQSPPKETLRKTTWNVVRTLGEGAFGEVKLVVDSRNSNFAVAVKCVDLLRHKDAIEAVRKEALLQRRLRGHRNIVQYIGMRMEGIDEFQIFLEYVDGGELFDQIEPDVGMPSTKAQFYFQQLIEGVRHMHSLGIAHRDIKPENILLTQNDVLKISDFGMATIFRHEGKERYLATRCGTLPYVSPQVMNGRYRGEASDIWSCGVVLVAMLAGELPWESPERSNPSFRSWVESTSLRDHPWKKIGNVALAMLRTILCEDEDSRASVERIQRHPWCTTDFTKNRGILSRVCSGMQNPQINDIPSKRPRYALDVIQESCSSDSHSQPATFRPAKVSYDEQLSAARDPLQNPSVNASFSQPVDMEALLLNYSQIDSQTQCTDPIQLLVRRMTRFCVNIGVSQTIDMIAAASESSGFEIKSVAANQVTVQTRCSTFIVAIYDMGPTTGGKVLVDFRRSRGDGIEFKRAFMELKNKLTSIICKSGTNWLEQQGLVYSQVVNQIST